MTFTPGGTMDVADLVRQMKARAAFAELGRLGGGLMAAAQGGLQPGDRSRIMANTFQGTGAGLMSPMQELQAYALAQSLQENQAELARRKRLTEALLGTASIQAQPTLATVAAQTGQMGPTVDNAMAQRNLASQGGGLSGQGGGLMRQGSFGPVARMYAAYDPEGAAKAMFEQSLTGPKAPTTVTTFDEDTGRRVVRQWDASAGDWRDLGGMQAEAQPSYMPREEWEFRRNIELANQKALADYKADLEGGKAPSLVTLYDEDTGREYKARYDPKTDGFTRVGGYKSGSTLTQPQLARNEEIDAARRELEAYIDREGIGPQEVFNRTKKASSSGLQNPNFDERLDVLLKTGANHKTGDDPGFNAFYRKFYGQEPPGIPGVQGWPEDTGGPGLVQQTRKAARGALGLDEPAQSEVEPSMLFSEYGTAPMPSLMSQPGQGGGLMQPMPLPPAPPPQAGPVAARPAQRNLPVGTQDFQRMSPEDLEAYVRQRGGEGKLTKAEIDAINARLDALETLKRTGRGGGGAAY